MAFRPEDIVDIVLHYAKKGRGVNSTEQECARLCRYLIGIGIRGPLWHHKGTLCIMKCILQRAGATKKEIKKKFFWINVVDGLLTQMNRSNSQHSWLTHIWHGRNLAKDESHHLNLQNKWHWGFQQTDNRGGVHKLFLCITHTAARRQWFIQNRRKKSEIIQLDDNVMPTLSVSLCFIYINTPLRAAAFSGSLIWTFSCFFRSVQ